MKKIVEIYKQVFLMLWKNPTVLFLFLLLGIFDAIALTILFFAPIPPVSNLLAPIIRAFWSDQYLHYPANFILLPKLFGHAHFLISTVIGVFFSGLIIKQIEAYDQGLKTSTFSFVGDAFKKYFSLLIGWLISYGVFSVSLKGLLYALSPFHIYAQLAGTFILSLLVQSLLGFLLPSLMIIKRNFFYAFWQGLKLGLRNVLLMSTVFFIPMLLALASSLVRLFTPIMVHIYPEAVLWTLAGGIVMTLIVDIFITSSATLVLLKVRNEQA